MTGGRLLPLLILAPLGAGCHALLPLSPLGPQDGSVEAGPTVPTLVRTGQIQVDTAVAVVDVPGVVPPRSFVLCSFASDNSEPYIAPTCQVGPTGITIRTGNPIARTEVRWHLVQLPWASVRRGRITLDGATSSRKEVVGPVDPGRTLVIVTSRIDTADRGLDQQRLVTATLTGGSTLELTRRAAGLSIDVEWQVIELAGARVVRGDATIAGGNSSVEVSPPAVDLQRSFLVADTTAPAAAGGKEEVYIVRGRLESGRMVFERGSPDSPVDVVAHWQVVELPQGSRVSGSYATPVKNALVTVVDIDPAVVVTRAFPLCSVYVHGGHSSELDSASHVVYLVNPTLLQLERADATAPVSQAWQVVELPDQS